MWLIGSVTWARAILLVIVQCAGAIIAAALVDVLFSGGLEVSTQLSSTTSLAQGFFIEMILSSQLVFAIFMLAAEKHAATFIAPVGIGLALFICELTGKFTTYTSLDGTNHFSIRCLLDRRVTQPCSIAWSSCCRQKVRLVSLDLLGWATCWFCTSSNPLQADQKSRI